MIFSRVAWIGVLVAVVALWSPSASAVGVRISSQNGQGTDVDNWMVMGRTAAVPLAANGKKVMMTRQVICAFNGDRADGGCASGRYVFLYQFQSTSANVQVNIGQLQKGSFTITSGGGNVCDDDPNDPTFGNNQELCTEDPGDPNGTNFATTFTLLGKTAVRFTINGAFPTFGPTNYPDTEGSGVTFYVVTQQTTPFPINFPSVGIH